MKTLGAFILVGAVVAFYMGYGPNDLVALWPSFGSSAPPPKVRRAAAEPAEQPQNPAPVQHSNNVVVKAPDGSLDQRWKP